MKREFGKYVSLNIFGMLGLSCYILADTFFVSAKMGADGLTALNLAISIYSFINGTGLMIGIGGGTKYSIYRSRGEKEKGNRVFTAALVMGVLIGIILFAVGIFATRPLSMLLGAEGKIIEMTTVYLRTILCFSPCFICNNIFLAFVRNDGNPRLSMIGMLVGSFSNVVLDYIFIFPADMGMFGAAFATGLAPVISMLILSRHKFSGKNGFHLQTDGSFWRYAKGIPGLGASSFINEVSSGVVLIVLNLLILEISGNTGVAAYGVIANLALVALSIFTGISQGSQPLLSKYYGEGNGAKVREIYRYMVILALAVGVFLVLTAFFATDSLIAVFNSEGNKELARIAHTGLRIYFLGFLAAGVNIVTAACKGALEQAGESFLISVMRGLICIVIYAAVLSKLFGMTGIWAAFPATEATTLLLSVFFVWRRKNPFSR